MPLLIIALALLVGLPLLVLMVPVSLVLRYRAGKARRFARRWVATTNLVSLVVSVFFYLCGAAVATLWVDPALLFVLGGLLAGGVLGLGGLALTRWESTPRGLFYTPSRWPVLVVTLAVTARVAYGFLRAWHVWHHGAADTTLLQAFGVPQSMAAGALVLGYYLVYFAGVRRRVDAAASAVGLSPGHHPR